MKRLQERETYFYATDDKDPDKDSEVFFNPEMLLNRDVSEIAGKVFREQIEVENFRVCDPSAASGIRGFRYSDVADKLVLGDFNPDAVEAIEKGLEENKIDGEVFEKDANVLLSQNRNFFHLIDVDPFGPFTKFLDSTARASNHQSFVGLTATDNSAPSGSYPTVCQRRYGSRPLRTSFMHETGLRIYIKEIFENFARYDKCFEPKVSFQDRHYSRIMGRVTESKSRCNQNLENIGYLSFCRKCRWRKLERVQECQYCGNEELEYAGPLWTGQYGDSRFTEKMLEKTPEKWEKAHTLVERLNSESQIRTPFYDIHELSSVLQVQAPKREKVLEYLHEKGYIVSRTHFEPTGFKTDAPFQDVRDAVNNS